MNENKSVMGFIIYIRFYHQPYRIQVLKYKVIACVCYLFQKMVVNDWQKLLQKKKLPLEVHSMLAMQSSHMGKHNNVS